MIFLIYRTRGFSLPLNPLKGTSFYNHHFKSPLGDLGANTEVHYICGMTLYQIDAFTDTLFGGNPAAVVPLEYWPSDEFMQSIAAENNLAETAFVVPEDDDFRIR